VSAYRLPADARPLRYALRFELDLDAWRFRGHERCDLVVDQSRREIVLHAVDLEISGAIARSGDRVFTARVEPRALDETVAFTFDDELAAGPWTLELDLAGQIRADLKALYRSTRGDERYAITTLWPAESRRLYVCFDEPPFKARFDLELVAARELVAVANSEVIDRRDEDVRTVWRFAQTPPLSPYLLAFAVGPFEGTDVVTTRSGKPVRIWVPRGLAGDGVYARDAQRDCVDRLEAYTGIPYPYDKVDGVGVTDFPAGAMENPGAVTYRLELVTADPAKASARALKSTVGVAAHELTHMWWGNLVTLAWWDDLWLSESFATFVGNRIENELHPEWGIWRDFVYAAGAGFGLDSLATTHAIHADAESAAAALQRVDAITYQKGAAVLRMLEAYLGEDAFRRGVRIYLERFQGSVATAADFWRALDEASGQDVSRIAEAWITEPGHPIVEVAVDGGALALRQRRFFMDPAAAPTAQRWPVPLVLRTDVGETRAVLNGEAGSVARPKGAWLFPNARAAGFYRVLLDDGLRADLLRHLAELSAEERLYLESNEWALLQSEATRADAYIGLVGALRGETDRAVLSQTLDHLRWASVHAVPVGTRDDFARLVEGLFRPAFDRLGFDPRADDDDDARELRDIAIRALGEVAGSPAVRAEAATRRRSRGSAGRSRSSATTRRLSRRSRASTTTPSAIRTCGMCSSSASATPPSGGRTGARIATDMRRGSPRSRGSCATSSSSRWSS
jgi:puromycin-sensitive aminopeptidase